MIILGLDISSSAIGYGVLELNDKNITLTTSGVVEPIKTGSIFQKLLDTKKRIIELVNKYNVDKVYIEDIIQFLPKRSSANTIIVLALFNRTIGLGIFEEKGFEPILVPVMTIRSKLKIKDTPKKEDMPAIFEHHTNIPFPWIKKKNKIIKINYDMADGLAVALYGAKQLRGDIP